jgi:cell division protein DivIC
MAYTGKKRKSIIFRILFLAFTVYIIISLTSLQVQLIGLKRELNSKTAYYNELNLEIEETLHLLDSGNETEFIEKAARERLGYYYPDEEVYIDISGQ